MSTSESSFGPASDVASVARQLAAGARAELPKLRAKVQRGLAAGAAEAEAFAASSTLARFLDTVRRASRTMFFLRLFVTLGLVAWIGLVIARMYIADQQHDKQDMDFWFQAHQVMFGYESTVFILFKMWYLSVLLALLFPFMSEIFVMLSNLRD